VTPAHNDETRAALAAESVALLQAALQTRRLLGPAGALDLNSALRAPGNARYASKNDGRESRNGRTMTPSEAASAFELALGSDDDDAFERLSAISQVVPNLVPALTEEAGPIHVDSELRAIVALTRHHWKDRLNVSVERPLPMSPFWCRWWIARLAAMRMIMLAAESRQRAPSNFNPERLPAACIGGRLDGPRFVLWISCGESVIPRGELVHDAVLALCARCLGGEISSIVKPTGMRLTSFHFPIRAVAAASGG
jgi:hypothetical protein